MLQAYSKGVSVSPNSIYPFNTTFILTGCVATLNGSTSINLNKPGIYMIEFNGQASPTGENGVVSVQLYNDGVAMPQANSSAYATMGNPASLSFSTLIKVGCLCPCESGSKVLTLHYEGVAGTMDGNIVVTKLR